MPRTPKFAKFKTALHKRCPEKGLDDWRYRTTQGAQVLDTGGLLLYVRDSGLRRGWWGVTKSVCKVLQQSDRDWRLVLFVRDGEEGYLLTRTQTSALITGRTENEASYILHEDQDTDENARFRSFEQLFSRLGL